MQLNFYLEGAGLIVCIILWIACNIRDNVIDLKDKIYIHMLRVVTAGMVLNMAACHIIQNNVSGLLWVSELVVCFSIWLMVWIWFYFNNYLLEVMHNRNSISMQTCLITGLPSFFNLLVLVANWVMHQVFDVSSVEGNVQVAFNSWYKIPYVLVACSVFIYLIILVKNFQKLRDTKSYVFIIVLIIMLVCYIFQYRFKSIAILGFGYSIALLLLYLYVYNYFVKIDSLTRLPNKGAFRKMLDWRIGANQSMAVAIVALNDFKRVNYEYGYHNGNKFIKAIGAYLQEVSPKDCLVRYGGDTFGIILEDTSEEKVKAWYEMVLSRFESTWQVGKLEHKITVCISLVTYPDMAGNSNEITDLLDYLNTHAKKYKKNQCIICNEEFKEKMQRRIRISSILKEIIEDGKMYVKYQPILDVEKNIYNRGEALFRLKDGLLGDIPPDEFFPIAEENGYVIEIGYVLIDKVCQYIRSFIEEGVNAPVLSVNFSRQQIMAENAEDRIIQILDKYELLPENIAIELPEDVFSVQFDAVRERVEQMASHGFRFYLDGFGTGFLDLPHLMELPFEIIKINKQMIRDAENNDAIYLLVSAMTAVFEENGKQILGDGIESAHLKEIADMLFMDYLQGYYFSEPVTEEKAREEFVKINVVEKMEDIDEILISVMEDENSEF